MKIEEAKLAFNKAIKHFTSYEIRKLLEDFVADNSIQDYFFTVPSSSSGKYHPIDELGEGGLVLHTLKCFVVADAMSRMWKLNSFELELAKAALLLHDTCKNGIYEDRGHTEFAHPLMAAENLMNHASKLDHRSDIKYKYAKKIARLIRSHMGQWNKADYAPGIKLPLPRTKLEKFVHECDYIASRKCFSINVV